MAQQEKKQCNKKRRNHPRGVKRVLRPNRSFVGMIGVLNGALKIMPYTLMEMLVDSRQIKA